MHRTKDAEIKSIDIALVLLRFSSIKEKKIRKHRNTSYPLLSKFKHPHIMRLFILKVINVNHSKNFV